MSCEPGDNLPPRLLADEAQVHAANTMLQFLRPEQVREIALRLGLPPGASDLVAMKIADAREVLGRVDSVVLEG